MTQSTNHDHNSRIIDDLLNLISPESQELTNMQMRLATKIYYAMKANGWNQSEFAKKMDKYDSEISKWLSGSHNFELSTLFAIEKILGIRLIDSEHKKDDFIPTLWVELRVPGSPSVESVKKLIDEAGGMQASSSVEFDNFL